MTASKMPNYLAELVKERFGYDEFLINDVGPTIGAAFGTRYTGTFLYE